MTKDLHCRFSPAQVAQVEAAAAAAHLTVSQFIRAAVGAAITTTGQTWAADPTGHGEMLARRARGEVYITIVSDSVGITAQVVRRRGQGRGNPWYIETATNWLDLNNAAFNAVLAVTGRLPTLGDYVCPPELAALAKWPE